MLSDEKITALKNALDVANRRLATNTLSDDQRKVFLSARDNALRQLKEHEESKKSQPSQTAPQQPKQAPQPQQPVRPAVPVHTPRPEINVQIKTPTDREPHTQMVVLEGNQNGDVLLRIPALEGSQIVIETPDGEKKKLTLGQAFSRLRSLIRERLVRMKKVLYASKCFALAVSLYGGLCLATSKSLTAKEVFQKTVSKEIKAVFNQVVTAWNSKKA